jgi:hypothetical protein
MSDVWDRITADLHAQLATNKRLLDGAWAQVAELTRERDAAFAQDHKHQDLAYERGRADERAAIVEWLAWMANKEKAPLLARIRELEAAVAIGDDFGQECRRLHGEVVKLRAELAEARSQEGVCVAFEALARKNDVALVEKRGEQLWRVWSAVGGGYWYLGTDLAGAFAKLSAPSAQEGE